MEKTVHVMKAASGGRRHRDLLNINDDAVERGAEALRILTAIHELSGEVIYLSELNGAKDKRTGLRLLDLAAEVVAQ
jgi:hypothetical protein